MRITSRSLDRTFARTLVAVLLVGAVIGAPGAAHAQNDPVAEAEARRDAAAAAANEAAADYEEASAEYYALSDEITNLRAALDSVEDEAAQLRVLASDQAVEAYMGVRNDFTNVINGDDVLEAVRRNELLTRVNAKGVDAIDRLGAVTDDLVARQAELEDALAQQEDVVEELSALEAELRDRLAEAQAALEDEIAEKEAREAAAARAAEQAAAREAQASGGSSGGSGSSDSGDDSGDDSEDDDSGGDPGQILVNPGGGGFVCPVQGAVAFTDSFGAPRSGGRSHQGVDMMAGFGTPLVAVVSGSISQDVGGLAGNSIWLSGSNGTSYFYAHLQDFVGGSRSVSAGEMIGTVGNTGNAQGGAPHLHFEIHPGGGGAINPYPTVAQYC
jgi:murein DD-endopeptidase MepM/ murein hydrolase activator NlpD